MKMSEQTRAKRETENREAASRPTSWKPKQLLPQVNEEPGWRFRWVRVSTRGVDDPTNISGMLQEGWEPVKASAHPEVQLFKRGTERFPDSIEIGGLLLCKTPVEFVEQRNAWFQKQADSQMNSVDNNFMRESDSRMPLYKERKSTVTFGKGF
jgi:hypothetical protein